MSKLPIHNLAKRGRINIEIKKRNDNQVVELHWEVSYSDRYGQPRQLAYKLDTLVINRRLDEEGRPISKALRLGSLSQICRDLEIPESGKNTNNIKKALLQNASTFITAKLNYKSNDGIARRLEAGFTRYSVMFRGERLPDGRKADAVYLIFNDPYWEVLNNAPRRPLDYDYLKELAPASQRFYEVISYRIFAALKYKHSRAKISYFDYCTFSAQQRYLDYDHFKKQMYKIHHPHLLSGYLTEVSYEEIADGEGNIDWMMYYTPGSKAKQEYLTFTRKGQMIDVEPEAAETTIEAEAQEAKSEEYVDSASIEELTKRGISEAKARKLLLNLKPNQRVLDQIDYGDDVIAKAQQGKFTNPPGFYIYLIESNVIVPESFETRRRKQNQQEAYEAEEKRRTEFLEHGNAYEKYQQLKLDCYVNESLSELERQKLFARVKQNLIMEYPYIAG
ncbi:MAG: hypothetical protein ACRD63_03380, partial [Pyrinomonadaceae bacterium]